MNPSGPQPVAALPQELEDRAAAILLGPPANVAAAFEALCAEHEAWRTPLRRFRSAYLRAARLLDESGDRPSERTAPAIPGYRCDRPIGEGAFGVVWLAWQVEPIQRQVAIKVLHATTISQQAIARFLNERETLARMNHPAVARIHDAGVDESGRPYFVMEYVPGEPLHRFVAARQASLRERLELFLAACEGVNHAHQRGVIHRDLKPHNILVAEVDGQWLPKVIDFGLAKALEHDPRHAVQTQAGAVLGTPAYMSPEQVLGDIAAIDTRTDVFALGVILFELLTGALPVPPEQLAGKGLGELQRLLTASDPPLASRRATESGLDHARTLRGDLDWILRKAMARSIDERYASVNDFAADVRRHLAHEPVTAGPPTTIYQLRKFVRRHRGGVVAAAVILLSLALGAVVAAVAWRQADTSASLARAHLADFWRLADVIELEDLIAAERSLWPSSHERIADHERWLGRARALLERQPMHAATIHALQQRLDAGKALSADELAGAQFLRTSLARHLTALDAFGGPDGLFAWVGRRNGFAKSVRARTLEQTAPAWRQAVETIAASPLYGGLRIRPMEGLVPLGIDLDSGLYEFAHLQSGRVPRRDASGALEVAPDTAIVLVLIPGGTRHLGSQDRDPQHPNYDPLRLFIEQKLMQVPVQTFLLGKYELTQGQVRRLGLAVQALGRAGMTIDDGRGGPAYDDRHPEESILAPVVAGWLPHFGLRLPDLAEWEFAARAGTSTMWGTGERAESVRGHANVAAAELAEVSEGQIGTEPDLDDGHTTHAPVGSYLPNPFGLHDMIGNIGELSVGTDPSGKPLYLARGGSFTQRLLHCRIGSIRMVMPQQTAPDLGVRVARDVAIE